MNLCLGAEMPARQSNALTSLDQIEIFALPCNVLLDTYDKYFLSNIQSNLKHVNNLKQHRHSLRKLIFVK